MASILDQILQAAADDSVSVSVLLRRVKVASSKLSLPKVEDWVNSELHGYDGTIPQYRKLRGLFKVRGFQGPWQVASADHDLIGMLSEVPLHDPIAAVESIAAIGDNFHTFGYGVEQRKVLDKIFGDSSLQFRLEVPHASIVSVIDQVRNAALDWALKMQSLGVKGVGFEFTNQDREKAQLVSNFNIGQIGSMVGGIGTDQRITASTGAINVTRLRSVVEQLKDNADGIAATTGDPGKTLAMLQTLAKEAAKDVPDQDRVVETVRAIETVLTGAAGNLIASGALSLLHTIFG